MEIKLLAHSQLSESFLDTLSDELQSALYDRKITDGQAIALSAIRNCYSHNKPSEILSLEGDKYFSKTASDGEGGTEADRLIRHIINSGHTSTMEHINFTFAIEGVSRSLLAQLTRHRHFSYSVESQRYVKFGSDDKAEGFNYVTPKSVTNNEEANNLYDAVQTVIQSAYDELRKKGVPAEDARYVLPNAATCSIVFTGSLRGILEFYSKRNPNTHAQWEIQELAEKIKEEVIKVEPWTDPFFNVNK